MAVGETLILEAKDFKDPQHWRWLLKDSQSKFLADQEVHLDSRDPNYSAFIDLEGYLKANSSPDKWLEDQVRLMQEVGAWIGQEALGESRMFGHLISRDILKSVRTYLFVCV